MKEADRGMMNVGMKIGALLGGIVFLAIGLTPAYQYGQYGTKYLLSTLLGSPLNPTIGVNVIMGAGLILAFVSLCFLSIVLGSVAGTATGFVVQTLTGAKATQR